MRHLIVIVILFSTSLLFSEIITLEKAKELALQNNPDLLAQEMATGSSRASFRQSVLSLLPSAGLTGNYRKYDEKLQIGLDEVEDSKSYGFTITQPIFMGGNIWFGSRIAGDVYKISNEALKSKKLSTIAEVESKYFTALENKTLLEISRKNLQSARTNTEIAKVKFETGTLSKADYLSFQAEQANKEISLLQMENLYQIGLLDLMNFLQISDVLDLEDILKDQHRIILEKFQTLNSEEIEIFTKKIIQIGRENNPVLKMSALTIETNKKSLIMAGGKFLPNISLSYSKNWRKYNIDNEFDASGQLELNLTLPIFPLLDTGFGVANAKYDLKQSGYNFESAENNLDLTLKSAVLNLVTAAKTVHSSQLALEYASETYTQMQERFSSNMITSNELLAAEIMFISAQNQNVSGFYDFLKAKSSLLQQMGLEDEKKLYQLIP